MNEEGHRASERTGGASWVWNQSKLLEALMEDSCQNMFPKKEFQLKMQEPPTNLCWYERDKTSIGSYMFSPLQQHLQLLFYSSFKAKSRYLGTGKSQKSGLNRGQFGSYDKLLPNEVLEMRK